MGQTAPFFFFSLSYCFYKSGGLLGIGHRLCEAAYGLGVEIASLGGP